MSAEGGGKLIDSLTTDILKEQTIKAILSNISDCDNFYVPFIYFNRAGWSWPFSDYIYRL